MSIVTDGYSYLYFSGVLGDFKLHQYENFAIKFVKQPKPINDVIVVMDVYNTEGYIVSTGAGTYSDYVNNSTKILVGCLGHAEQLAKVRIHLSVPYTVEEINTLIRNKLQFSFLVVDQECFTFDLSGNVYLYK